MGGGESGRRVERVAVSPSNRGRLSSRSGFVLQDTKHRRIRRRFEGVGGGGMRGARAPGGEIIRTLNFANRFDI